MPEAASHLEKVSFAQINLPDQSYRWAVIKGFTWVGDGQSGLDLLAALCEHPAFKDHYCAPGEDGIGEEPLHGPYRLDALSTTTFVLIRQDEALKLLDAWLMESGDDEGEPTDEGVARALNPVRELLQHEAPIYYLPDLGEAAQHDWGWVLWHFREWVVIDHGQRKLHSIACGLD